MNAKINKKIPCNVPLVDSFSLKIPLNDVDVIDDRLTSETHIYYIALESIDSEPSPPKPIIWSSEGITVRVGLANVNIWDNENKIFVPTKFVNLTVSAKLLKERYFEGITKENIEVIYNQFLSFEIFYCTLEVFCSGYVSDVDICINRYANSVDCFDDALSSLMVQSGTKIKHLHKINADNNCGMTMNKRDFAKPSLPFVKFYFKEYELKSKSLEFYDLFLQDNFNTQIKNLTRVEATIKNYAHKSRLAKYKIMPMFKSLQELLEIQEKELYNFVVFSVGSYVETVPRVKAPDLSPMDHIIFELMQNCVMKGFDIGNLLNVANTFKGSTPESTAVAQSRIRTKIKNLGGLLLNKDIKIHSINQHNNHVLEYLNFINLKV